MRNMTIDRNKTCPHCCGKLRKVWGWDCCEGEPPIRIVVDLVCKKCKQSVDPDSSHTSDDPCPQCGKYDCREWYFNDETSEGFWECEHCNYKSENVNA